MIIKMNDRLCFPYEDKIQNISGFPADIRLIYDKMLDDVSRDIFSNRLLLSLTGNPLCLKSILLHTAGGKRLNAILHETGKTPYIYGAGIRGRRLVEMFPDVDWGGIIDRNKPFESFHNIKILDLEQFMSLYMPGMAIIVSNMSGTDEIVNSLIQKQVAVGDIYTLNSFDKENVQNIYFPSEELKLPIAANKAFVDIGCYDGKDSLRYLQWSNQSEAKVYAFEPDIKNYQVCRENLKTHINVELFNIGLSDVEEEIGIAGEGEMAYLGVDSEIKVQTRVLDNMLEDKEIGFIKMDVEGYEEPVLRGAGRIIRNQHPVLAVSIYHKKSDIWRIPKLLLEYYGDYCFYMRHYSAANGDTVLYAVGGIN